jgi:hypothetical protein
MTFYTGSLFRLYIFTGILLTHSLAGSAEHYLQLGLRERGDWDPTAEPVPPPRHCRAGRGKT